MPESIPILLTVVGMDAEENQISLSTQGFLEENASGFTLSYEETELDGLQTIDNRIEAEEDGVLITRSGGIGGTIYYRVNKSFEGEYDTPMGRLFLRVLPTSVRVRRRGGMGHIHLAYQMSLTHHKGDLRDAMARTIDIRFAPRRSQ